MHLGLLQKGQTAVVTGLSPACRKEVRQRLLDLGFVKGAEIRVQNISPLNDPVSYNIYNTLISLRRNDAANVLIEIKEQNV
ncbi:MAG TPA: iron transporter FeoA [Porphyromonadaceae bacterium]|jgi:ferrous iron transport protein A|uniref:FeoA family protein n=1 Tax=Limibacterium fermenti TaxID=3229863 RepID=UPI000E9A7468|nr:iron transporter FeoA [Porphyromonadaceae bacterium]HBK31211.1 iron transporter FeoA [Porphyromonadaceae bacterium]HBL34876.1 iron transporter FeoA [Porphyromonadaceae bacterium]HBX19200.1 iron transporter FeoA [Porphyromonadaceae bacterium]HBX46700.1 iron transporter FeoA [Porphyromonadaceae bacterium]